MSEVPEADHHISSPSREGRLYHIIHSALNSLPRWAFSPITGLVFRTERFYVEQLRPRLGRRPSEKHTAYRWASPALSVGTGRVLDVGCGDSLFFSQLLGSGHQVCAIDLTPYSIARHPRLWYVLGDVTQAPFASNTFDYIIAISTLEHIAGIEAAAVRTVAELRRILSPSGTLLITLPMCKGTNEYPFWRELIESAKRMRDLLMEGFEVVREEYYLARVGETVCSLVSREAAAAADPQVDLIVAHLALRRALSD